MIKKLLQRINYGLGFKSEIEEGRVVRLKYGQWLFRRSIRSHSDANAGAHCGDEKS